MSPAERREMIVRVALPLVTEYGTAVTTSQIARAAGIGEATIFRVFADKDELIDACVHEALRGDHVINEVRAIPLDQPLEARLREAAAAMEAYLARMGAVLGALRAGGRRGRRGWPGPANEEAGARGSGGNGGKGGKGADAPAEEAGGRPGPGRPRPEDGLGHRPGGREEALARTVEAVAELFEPDRDRLRLPPEKLAAIFMHLGFDRARRSGEGLAAGPSLDDAITVFLHGALVPGDAPHGATDATGTTDGTDGTDGTED
ncbi:TetR/AcrR family transcriptional regulator [Bailinhaonella thermotolerans]|uniref:TetR/AcrR family transcriptional regulator n=2 Tax=Bailinhaonella thermotolerans TaxID=1070861 RepID=A0A3A4B0S3_9ACTN|nr:TetR/AcrR family transcriptional regulator [Bailinhaonella thermotolerans]